MAQPEVYTTEVSIEKVLIRTQILLRILIPIALRRNSDPNPNFDPDLNSNSQSIIVGL